MDTKSKKCFKCGENKPLSEYYSHKMMADGHLNKCKACTRSDVAKRVEHKKKTDPEWVYLEKERSRMKQKNARNFDLDYNARHKPSKVIWSDMSVKKKATTKASEIPCPDGAQRHHWSYLEKHWKDVIILSRANHYKVHRFMQYDPERKQYRTIHGVLLDSREISIRYYLKVKSIEDGVYSELEKLKSF